MICLPKLHVVSVIEISDDFFLDNPSDQVPRATIGRNAGLLFRRWFVDPWGKGNLRMHQAYPVCGEGLQVDLWVSPNTCESMDVARLAPSEARPFMAVMIKPTRPSRGTSLIPFRASQLLLSNSVLPSKPQERKFCNVNLPGEGAETGVDDHHSELPINHLATDHQVS